MKDLKIIKKMEFASFVACGFEYLCIEQITSQKFILNIRRRETIGDLEELMLDWFELMKKKYTAEEYDQKHESGELDDMWSEEPIPESIDGNKVVEVEDGQYLLGEKLICYQPEYELIFQKLDASVKHFIDELSEINHLIKDSKDEIIEEIEEYVNS